MTAVRSHGGPRRPRQRVLGSWDSRAPTRRMRHGLSPSDIDAMRLVQGGRCAICLRSRRLVVDHDHRHCPGQEGCPRCVRGLLCAPCNGALGELGGDDAIPRLVVYLGGTL